MTEPTRLLIFFLCFANVGIIAGLYGRIGRYFIPKVWMRLTMVGVAGILVVLGLSNVQHIHRAIAWPSFALLLCTSTVAVGFVGLWHWYGTPGGQEHAARMIESVDRFSVPDEDTVARQIRWLGIRVLLLYGGTLVAILVVGFFVVQTHTALCSFRGDLHERYDSGVRSHVFAVAYADAHPGPIFGIPHAQIDVNLAQEAGTLRSQKRALDSLHILHC